MSTETKIVNFSKVVRVGQGENGDVFCKIEFANGKLSISGVEGPTRNGNARGSCGQIVMSEWNIGTYAPGWDAEIEKKFREIWDTWHLNDMRAGCQHQRGPEWEPKDITIYHFRLSDQVEKEIKAAKKRALAVLLTGETFTPTIDEVKVCTLEDRITSPTAELPEFLKPYYVPNGPQYAGDHYNKPFEVKKSNWVNPSEHPEGYLSKPCPVCDYKYGHAWIREEVPAEVIEFLKSLPDTDKTPAWV